MEYPEDDIVKCIAKPKEMKRGVFQVSELDNHWE
jgi:hypothetical protein